MLVALYIGFPQKLSDPMVDFRRVVVVANIVLELPCEHLAFDAAVVSVEYK